MHRRDICFLMDLQLCPKVGYGIFSLTATWKHLEECLRNKHWQVIPLGGIIRSAPTPLRQTNRGFYSAGCPHTGVECAVAQVNKLLMHYGCPSSLGVKIRASLDYLILELGISVQPLQESFRRYNKWVTRCWLVSLWEKCDKFDILIEFNDVNFKPP